VGWVSQLDLLPYGYPQILIWAGRMEEFSGWEPETPPSVMWHDNNYIVEERVTNISVGLVTKTHYTRWIVGS
jgi:hypothetical protein